VPYRDAWDIKAPDVYYLFWATFSAFRRSMFGIRLLDLLWTLAAAAALFVIARRLFSCQGGWASAFFFLVCYALGFDFWHTAQADGFGSLPPDTWHWGMWMWLPSSAVPRRGESAPGGPVRLPEGLERQLRALGYVD
jgi:hypothetical protein